MPNTNNNPEPGNAGNPDGKPTIGVGHNMNRLRSSGASRHPHTEGGAPSNTRRNAASPDSNNTPPRQNPRDAGPRR
jgi:hypothetical protein